MFIRIGLATLAALAAMPSAAQTVGPANPATIKRVDTSPADPSMEAPVNGVLTLYGNQRCPTDKDGNEVVVCKRVDAAEQFRIPQQLRNFKVTPQNESWAKQQSVTMSAGQVGIGSCSAVGPSAGTGCLGQQISSARAQNKERKKDETPDLSGY